MIVICLSYFAVMFSVVVAMAAFMIWLTSLNQINATQIQIKNQRKTTWEKKRTNKEANEWKECRIFNHITRGRCNTKIELSQEQTQSMHLFDDQRVVLVPLFYQISSQCIFEWTIECLNAPKTNERTPKATRQNERDGKWTQKSKNGKWIIQLNSLQY